MNDAGIVSVIKKTEKTLQSIDSTLKRIEKLLESNSKECIRFNTDNIIKSLSEGIKDALAKAAEINNMRTSNTKEEQAFILAAEEIVREKLGE